MDRNEVVRTEGDHRSYLLEGVELPSVTDILTDAGYIDKERYNAFGKGGFYRDRGQFVHEACELIDKGCRLDAGSIDGYAGYVNAYQKAKEKYPFLNQQPVAIEKPIANLTLRYGGTPDRLFPNEIVDFKTSKTTAPWWILQMAAYGILALREPVLTRNLGFPDLYILQLKEDGEYRLLLLNKQLYVYAAFRFVAALVQYHQRRKLPAADMLALVGAAVETLSALQEQLNAISTSDHVAAGADAEDEAGRVLAHRVEGQSAGWKTGGDAGRPPTVDEGSAAVSNRSPRFGRNERLGISSVGERRQRRRQVPAPDAVRSGVPAAGGDSGNA